MVKLIYFVRAALSGLRNGPFVHAVAVLTIAVALFAAGLARYGVLAIGALLESWGSQAEITFYLKTDVAPEAAQALLERMRSQGLGEARLVTPDAALERLRAEFGQDGDVLSNLPKNPLQASIEVKPAAGRHGSDSLAAIAREWEEAPEIESAEYGREWLERLEGFAGAARGAGAILLLVVLLAAVVVVSATLQLAIYARREEIEILKLVGATDPFVKTPFLFEGMLQGLLGGSLAAAGLWGFARHLGPRIADVLGFVAGSATFPRLVDVHGWLELAVAGGGLGLLGSFVAVRRFLRV